MGKKGKGKQTKKSLSPYPYKFNGLVLDDFQAQAILRLQQGTSTIVSAPTGTGKTLIADYLVYSCLADGKRVVYTGPIKALVSQKYRNFKSSFGRERVGIMTGDVSVNPTAPVVVMTTEIFRNMLLREPEKLNDVSWVVFDEIHYLDHDERGTVWEEAILFMPPQMRLLGLSATVPNAKEIGAWIQSVHNDPVAVVHHDERAVPLVHLFYNQSCQAVPREQLLHSYIGAVMPGRDEFDTKAGALDFAEVWNSPRVYKVRDNTTHLDLINFVARERLFPCLFFVFSRRGCQEKADELARRSNFLDSQEREIVRVAVKRTLEELQLSRSQIPDIDKMEEQWRRGIAVHHAGLLPAEKRIVEVLLERKVLRVVYATETFAVGVNMPVRCVCFDSLQKYDGSVYRPLTYQEYFQMAGRAGRRGADRQGTVISLVDFSGLASTKLPDWDEAGLEAIQSRIHFSYNMVANLTARYSNEEVGEFCKRTLAAYQERRQHLQTPNTNNPAAAQQLFSNYLAKKQTLASLGYIEGESLTEKGESLRSVYVKELLVTELLYSDLLTKLSTPALAGLAASLVYEGRSTEGFSLVAQPWMAEVGMATERLERRAGTSLSAQVRVFPPIAGVVARWAGGADFVDVLQGLPLQAGDMVTLCRQAIDLLRQMINARQDQPLLVQALTKASTAIDRDVVQVHL